MLEGASPIRKMRIKLLDKCSERDLSYRTIAEMTVCMDGKTEEEKEILAKQLLAIISKTSDEKEIIEKAMRLR